jgi:hypothetical protein
VDSNPIAIAPSEQLLRLIFPRCPFSPVFAAGLAPRMPHGGDVIRLLSNNSLGVCPVSSDSVLGYVQIICAMRSNPCDTRLMDNASLLTTYRPAESSSAESPEIAARPLTVRSALTNDPLKLRGIDGRSVDARRYRDVAIALADDLGGQDKLSESSKILVRQAAALTVQVEGLQSKIVAGADVDIEQLTRLSNSLSRMLHRLGLRKRVSPKLSVPEYLAQRDARRAQGV